MTMHAVCCVPSTARRSICCRIRTPKHLRSGCIRSPIARRTRRSTISATSSTRPKLCFREPSYAWSTSWSRPNITEIRRSDLKTVTDMGVAAAKADGAATVARMKAMPTDDDCFGPGRIREDGRKIHPAYLFEVKQPSESKHAWDLYK